MTDRYVGPGGDDANSGLTWALRKLTLNGVEDTPVVAGDTVYVGPGVYREQLICDIDGTVGNRITYIGDVTGENTDGVGGRVRLTGHDTDLENQAGLVRTTGLEINADNYRTFRGFSFDGYSSGGVGIAGGSTNTIIEDCVFVNMYAAGIIALYNSYPDTIIRRCIFYGRSNSSTHGGLHCMDSTQRVGEDWLVENCIFIGGGQFGAGIIANYREGWVVRNCVFFGPNNGIEITYASADPAVVNNCIFYGCDFGVSTDATVGIVEDYNCFWNNSTDRLNVAVGSNSVARSPLWDLPILLDGYILPNMPFLAPSKWSDLKRKAGTGESAEDLYGIVRPATASKKSWGALQFRGVERETTITHDSSVASVKLDDAGEIMFFVPVDGSEITVSVQVYREANYAGTLPTMIIRQPGQSDRSTVDTGSASQWNELNDTFTPDSGTEFVVIILRSLNTATSGSYAAYFDNLGAS